MKNKDSHTFITILFIIIFFIAFFHISFAINLLNIKEAVPPQISDEGVLFTFKGDEISPKYVIVSGDFNNWEENILMTKNRYNIFFYLFNKTKKGGVVLNEGKYRYMYQVDSMWIKDPLNKNVEYDQYGTQLSYFKIHKPIIIIKSNPVHLKNNNYIFYYKNDSAKNVYLVGDFNNWNPYSLHMIKDKSGYWKVVVDIIPGAYTYRFLVDGEYKKDPLSETLVYDRFYNKLTFVIIPHK